MRVLERVTCMSSAGVSWPRSMNFGQRNTVEVKSWSTLVVCHCYFTPMLHFSSHGVMEHHCAEQGTRMLECARTFDPECFRAPTRVEVTSRTDSVCLFVCVCVRTRVKAPEQEKNSSEKRRKKKKRTSCSLLTDKAFSLSSFDGYSSGSQNGANICQPLSI